MSIWKSARVAAAVLAMAAVGCGGKAGAPGATGQPVPPAPEQPNAVPAAPQTGPQATHGSCDVLRFDLYAGALNGVSASASQEQVKAALPCFTGDSAEGDAVANYGGGVFFLDHDFYFYTGNDFIEVRAEFKGEVTPPLLRKPRADVVRELGAPVEDDGTTALFAHAPGCIRCLFVDDVCEELSVHLYDCARTAAVYSGE